MCTTCGCSDHSEPAVIDLNAVISGHPHDHVGEHEHAAHDAQHHGQAHHHDHAHHHENGAVERPPRVLHLEQDLVAKNNQRAAHNREWFAHREIVALNLMSAPGAGKTTLLERMIRDFAGEVRISVVEGDQATVLDGARIRATGCRVVQINTGVGCHLDAEMVARALQQLDPPPRSLVLIENVGNLVCPALFELGEQAKVVIMSVTEGEDKPLKYPHMFRAADVLLLNKVDLLPYLQFSLERCLDCVRQVNPALQVIPVSAQRGDGLDTWYAWLRARLTAPVMHDGMR